MDGAESVALSSAIAALERHMEGLLLVLSHCSQCQMCQCQPTTATTKTPLYLATKGKVGDIVIYSDNGVGGEC